MFNLRDTLNLLSIKNLCFAYILALSLLLTACCGDIPDFSSLSEDSTSTYRVGETFKVGYTTYTVNSYFWSPFLRLDLNNQPPNSMYLVVDLTIQNSDKEARMIPQFYLIDDTGAEHKISMNSYLLPKNLISMDSLNPGIKKRGQIAFDVPQDRKYKLKVSGGYWSINAAYVALTSDIPVENKKEKVPTVSENKPNPPVKDNKARVESETEKSLTVKPINALKFKYEYCNGGIDDSYNYYEMLKGIHTYSTSNDEKLMSIISEDDINNNGTEEHKSALKFVKRMVDGKLNIIYDQYDSNNTSYNFNYIMGNIFYPREAGFAADMSGLINNVKYPGMDQVIAFYTIDGQNPPAGDISIIVLAKKGKNYIMLQSTTSMKTVNADGTERPLFKKCVDKYDYTDQTRQCYVKEINNNKDIQETLTKNANELVKLFAIK